MSMQLRALVPGGHLRQPVRSLNPEFFENFHWGILRARIAVLMKEMSDGHFNV